MMFKRSLVGAVLLTVLTIGVILVWRWRHDTREARALCEAVSVAALDADTKAILKHLAWTPRAWDSGLIQVLRGPLTFRRLAWKGVTKHRPEGNYDIYIFDAFIRPVADNPIPPICVVLDRDRNLVTWETVATFSSGFLSASLDDLDVLTITTVANFFAGKGIYRYQILEDAIVDAGGEGFQQFSDEENLRPLPELALPSIAPKTPD